MTKTECGYLGTTSTTTGSISLPLCDSVFDGSTSNYKIRRDFVVFVVGVESFSWLASVISDRRCTREYEYGTTLIKLI